MGLNDGLLETFIFNVNYGDYAHVTVKVVINLTKGMYTVYATNGRIMLRKEKMPLSELNTIRQKIRKYINDQKKPINILFRNGSVIQ